MERQKICFVDDEKEILALYTEFLQDEFELKIFESPDQLLDHLSDNSLPDLIVSDYRMPQYSGLDLVRKLRDRQVPTPMLMISGFLEKESIVKALNLGVFRILEKPFEFDEFELAIRQSLALSSLNEVQESFANTSESYLATTKELVGAYQKAFHEAEDLLKQNKIAFNSNADLSIELARLEAKLEGLSSKLKDLQVEHNYSQRILGLKKNVA